MNLTNTKLTPEKNAQLVTSLKNLTPKQAEIIELIFVENMTQEQIANKLGISRASVRDRLNGALKKLR